MAVKQSNNDANDAPSVSSTTSTTAANGGGKGNTAASGAAKKNNLAHDGDGGGGNIGAMGDNNDKAGCSPGLIKQTGVNSQQNGFVLGSGMSDMEKLLHVIEVIEQRQKSHLLNSYQQMLVLYEHVIRDLSRMQIRQTPEDLKRFKEDITKVGAFLSKPNEKRLYFYYLRLVYKLMTQSPQESPSCALAIVFQLFNPVLIIEAVQSLLEHNVLDISIRKTVELLCEWVRICNFCQNLNLWVMAILAGLHEQEKYLLLDEIALDNIEKLFSLLILPALRVKVAPIVFHMLSTIHQTPEIFHQILPKIPPVIRYLKQQSKSCEEYAEDTKKCIQKLVDVVSALMVRFYGFQALYLPVEQAFKDYQPSYNYLSLASGIDKNEDEEINNLLPNNTNARVGLVNLGNTCYMNSVLQALAMTKEFSREIMLVESKSPLLLKMQQQIALMHYSARFELTPTRVLNATRPPGFSPGLQQDSSEFLGYLLDTLHEQEVAFHPKFNCVQDSAMSSGALIISDIAPNGVIPYETFSSSDEIAPNNPTPPTTPTRCTNSIAPSPAQQQATIQSSTIEKTFNGKLATIYKCLTCGWQSRNVDSFRDLQLSFPEAKNDCSASNYSVQDLIEYYCSPEKLDGDNQYFCERCKKLTDAERYISVISAPKNLILTLKHFKYDQKYHMRAKLMHKVFHDEKVNVKVCSSDSLDEIATVHYDLYAGVVHSGFSMDSGHYYTYAADESNKWYKFNDNIVTHSKSEELHNLTPPNTPYILFYQMSARSNESPEAAASTKVVKVDVPLPLTLEQLPRSLRDYVTHDNGLFTEELKVQRMKQNNKHNDIFGRNNRNSQFDDDDDQSPPPSSNGCGGNAMGMNVNRFVY